MPAERLVTARLLPGRFCPHTQERARWRQHCVEAGLLGLAAIMIEALLACGLEAGRYGDLMDLSGEVVERANGLRNADWLLDLAGLTFSYPNADTGKRSQLLYQVMAVLRPTIDRLPPRQRHLLNLLARDLQLTELIPTPAVAQETEQAVARGIGWLAGKTVGIYSLTESAAIK